MTPQGPWHHLQTIDGWARPADTTNNQCDLMVQLMESWFLTDMETLKSFYGQGFRAQAFPANPNIEAVPKQNIRDRLAQATRDTKKGSYSKGNHSVEILTRLDPVNVRNPSHHADRLIRAL